MKKWYQSKTIGFFGGVAVVTVISATSVLGIDLGVNVEAGSDVATVSALVIAVAGIGLRMITDKPVKL